MIEITKPENWVVIEIANQHKKVFGMWSGGYLDGDEWRANSGIVKCEVKDDFVLFHGMSGSIYKCSKITYRETPYGSTILKRLQENQELRVLSKEEAFNFYNIEE